MDRLVAGFEADGYSHDEAVFLAEESIPGHWINLGQAFAELGKTLLAELLRAVNWTLGIVVRGLRRVNR